MNTLASHWIVITGAPCSGKTTTIEALSRHGYTVRQEAARLWIQSEMAKGRTIEEIREDELKFQTKIFDMNVASEKPLDRSQTIFFDRGIPDSLAFFRLLKLPVSNRMKQILKQVSYSQVFILDPLPLDDDDQRTETREDNEKLDHLTENTYTSLGLNPIRVPIMSVDERVNYILARTS